MKVYFMFLIMAKILRQTTNRINSRLFDSKVHFGFKTQNSQKLRQFDLLQKIKPFQQQQTITDPNFMIKCPTFHKQVLSCVFSPQLIGGSTVSQEASKRASIFLNQVKSVGSYSTPLGTPLVRKNIAQYITQSTGIESPSIDNVILMPSVAHAIQLIIKCLIQSQNDSVMLPVPGSSTYKKTIKIFGGKSTPYYLNRAEEWNIDFNDLQNSYREASKNAQKIKALVLVNPGNPTGTVYGRQTLEKLVKFARKKKLLIIADEVNSDYIYDSKMPFIPIMKVINQMGGKYLSECEVISLYSMQKTPLGAMGVKAGYIHCHNINPEILEQFLKLWNMCFSSNICGQIALDLVKRPFLHDVSDRIKQQYFKQKDSLFYYMKRRVELVKRQFQEIQNVKITKIQAGNYGYAQIDLPDFIIQKAKSSIFQLDEYFCQLVKKELNLQLAPGKTYGHQPTKIHFGINILSEKQEQFDTKLKKFKQFLAKIHQQSHI